MSDRETIVISVAQRLTEILPDFDAESPDENQDLREYPAFDSLSILELLVWLETEFSVAIPDEELMVENFTTLGKMADYVHAHRG